MTEIWDIYDEDGSKTGKVVRRGDPLNEGEYHLVTAVWIRNSKGQYLISKRSQSKPYGGMLETVGGCAVSGEDSGMASVREVHEELGITVGRSELCFLAREKFQGERSYIVDVWLVESDVAIEDVVCQAEEVEEVQWMDRAVVHRLMETDAFLNGHIHKKLFELEML